MESSSSLPIVDLSPLKNTKSLNADVAEISRKLGNAFETTGFAYLTNAPLNLDHGDIFGIAKELFSMSEEQKMKLAKKMFRKQNGNTYRGYFPAQNGSDNLKEGFEIGPPDLAPQPLNSLANISLTEANVWPEKPWINIRPSVETLHRELQTLSVRVLSLLAVFLNRPPDYFASFSKESVSTLRFLHYPAIIPPSPQQELCCTPHTDSGILTLLHQDSTGGLEVLTAGGAWIDTPYVPGSIVINAGDLMAKVSGGKFKATCHRVRSIPGKDRYSVPFFFEPGVDCLLTSIDSEEEEDISYGQHVLEKMEGWIEFRDLEKDEAIVEAVEEIEEGVEL